VVLTVENSRSWTFAPQVLAGLGAGCPKPFPPAVTYAAVVEPRNQPMNDRDMLQPEKPEDEAQGFHRSKTERFARRLWESLRERGISPKAIRRIALALMTLTDLDS
jgi:hypothetical protein